MSSGAVDAVLVPVDTSSYARRGLLAGAAIADRLGVGLVVLSVVTNDEEAAGRDAELADFVAEHLGQPRRPVHCTVAVHVDPAAAILEVSSVLGDSVTCMATHGRGRAAALLGSVAADVVDRSPDPLVLAGPLVEAPPTARRVVACVDDDDAAVAVVEAGVRWAQLLDDPLTVISVAEPAPPPMRGGTVRRAFGPDGDVEGFLRWLVEPFQGIVPVATAMVEDPISPASGIGTYLGTCPAFLLVAGSHARHGVRRLVFGTSAAGIVRRGGAPVLVVPARRRTP